VSLKTLLVAALIALGFTAFAARAQATLVPVTIDYPSFSEADSSGLQLNGSAVFAGSALQMTPAKLGQSGTAFSRTEIQPTGSFKTEFELYMHETTTLNTYGPADGIAFVLQPKSDEEVGEPGGSMGYQGITPSVEVEFDLYRDPYDPPVPNVSLMENGEPEDHIATEPTPFPLYDEHIWSWIEYNAEKTELSVYVANTDTEPATPLFTYKVNLAELLDSEYTYAGFTSGTGSGDAVQEVLDWQLTSTSKVEIVPPAEIPPAEISRHGSSTSVTCNLIFATASDTCIATVTDVDVPAAITPTGQVSFSSASGGTFPGSVCSLVAIPNSPDAAGCSVQFLPPTAASLQPAITATYGGDSHHSGSVGHTYYGPANELAKGIEIGLTGLESENGSTVTVPVGTPFPSVTGGTLTSGTTTAKKSSFAGAGAGDAVLAKAKPHKKKQTAKPVVFGTGSLTLSKPGKGLLTIKLNGKAKLALKQAKGKPIKVVLEVTVKTLNGTLVTTEKKTITIRPAKKQPKKKGKHGK
jgi:hypothetical protein